MKTYLVFGNAKNTYQSTTFVHDNAPVAIADGLGRLTIGTDIVEGAVLSADDTDGEHWPAHVSVLVSETEPGEVTTNRLLAAGWAIAPRAPRGVTVPFAVDAVLAAGENEGDPIFFAVLWADKGYAPMQRTHVRAPGGEAIPARVLSYGPGPSGRPQVTFYADREAVHTDGPFAPLPGWNGPSPALREQTWAPLVALSAALEAEVGYLLGTPVVVGMNIADPAALDALDPGWLALLPEDERAEAAETLAAAGRGDLAAACGMS